MTFELELLQQILEEQRKTNELLTQLLPKQEGPTKQEPPKEPQRKVKSK